MYMQTSPQGKYVIQKDRIIRMSIIVREICVNCPVCVCVCVIQVIQYNNNNQVCGLAESALVPIVDSLK